MTLPPVVRELYPFESRFLRLESGHRMHYIDEGTGPPLLLLHGNPTWSFYYRDIIRDLRSDYRCIAPDHIGCGLSDKPQHENDGIVAHVDNLLELVAHLDLKEVTLVIHDWGGPIGFLTAMHTPDRFRRFITFNTAATLLSLPRILTLLRRPGLGALVIQRLNGMLRAGFMSTRVNGHGMPATVRKGYLHPYDTPTHRHAILRFVQEIPVESDHPNRALLETMAGGGTVFAGRPHLVIWGMRDPVFGPPYLADWHQRFPTAEVHRIEDAGHWVIEEASPRILPLMREFLERS